MSVSDRPLLSPALHTPDTPRIVILGGGFGGLELVKRLKKLPVQVVLIDRNNYHTFQPLLYQVATGGLEPASIAYPFRKLFTKQENVIFRMAEAEGINAEEKIVYTNLGFIKYNYLVVATGSMTNFYGMEGVQSHAARMKTVSQALDLRSIILQNFEESLQLGDVGDRDKQMNIVIVGGGPTGVETAGALGELKRYVFPKDYPELDLRRMKIHLIEAADRLLPTMSLKASQKALQFVKELGVHAWLNTHVKDYDGRQVSLQEGQVIEAKTLIWSAGVKGASLSGLPSELITRNARIQVNEFNQVIPFEHVFAIGDVAQMTTDEFPHGHPMVAPVAIQQADLLYENLKKILSGKKPAPFKYKDKGSMATIGRNRAVVDLPVMQFQGTFAWFVWMFVHLMSLVGFRNKLVAFVDWFWNYLSYDKALRLIIRPFKRTGN